MEQWLMVIGTWLMALGTIVVAFLAIAGEEVRERLFRPKLTLEHMKSPPDSVKMDPLRYYEHLWLPNSSRTVARNCRVLLQGVARMQPNGVFTQQLVPIPLQFTWSPSEMPPLRRDITRMGRDIIDLGFVVRGQAARFQPQFYVTPVGHDYSVSPESAVRYFVQVVADNGVSPIHMFEVAWDGNWDDNPATMRDHLKIKDVTKEHVVKGEGEA